MKERWVPIEGYEGLYELSDTGRVRRASDCNNAKSGKILRAKLAPAGPIYQLCKHGKAERYTAQTLVLNHFVGPKPSPGHHAEFIDGDKRNASIGNLRWKPRSSREIAHPPRSVLAPELRESTAPLGLSNTTQYALVDVDLFPWLSKARWRIETFGYVITSAAQARALGIRTERHFVWLHRVIAKTPAGMETDHVNGKRLDNRRANLRVCTHAENRNNQPGRLGQSRFKGVSWCQKSDKWRAYIFRNGKHQSLGRFDSEKEAARAYDKAAVDAFGDFAYLNFGGPIGVRNEAVER
jgi:hypothetical protein